MGKEFILYLDHEALKFLNSQKWISNNMHARQVTFLKRFSFKLVRKVGVNIKEADTLGWGADLLAIFFAKRSQDFIA